MDSYKLGTTALNIILSVDINTTGTAATKASKRLTGSSGAGASVAHSKDASGDIKNSDIGGAVTLSGFTITIGTTIALFGDKNERKTEYDKITGTYFLSGGDEGDKNFTEADLKLHNRDYTNATLVKNISLIP